MRVPQFYNPDNVGRLYAPQATAAVDAGREAGITPSSDDQQRVILLLVDAQVDFVHPDGALSVPGAVDDTRRTIEWIFANLPRITTIAASLDSHVPIQIFSPAWWINEQGEHPAPYTPISSDEVRNGKWRPLYEPKWSVEYTERLERQAKKQLMIWPYHTLIGTPGHSLVPALYEAVAYHAAARQSQPHFLHKGSIPKTEHYSMLEPEVKVPDQPLGNLNTAFLDMLARYDLVYIAGQAKSHCVLETVTSVMRYFASTPEIIRKLRLLIDCTSSVAHPEIDFDALANATLEEYAGQGLQLVKSTDPLG
jgi:nicotinamidase-related amidase